MRGDSKPPNKLSGPKGHFLLGHLPEFAGDMLGLLSRCARQHGDVVALRLGMHRPVLLNHPDQIEQVLLNRRQDFIKHRFFWRHVRRIFGDGLLTSSGEHWRRQHALIAPAFRPDRLSAAVDEIVDCVEDRIVSWREGAALDVRVEMARMTLRIIGRVLFGLDLERDAQEVSSAVDRGTAEVAHRFKRGYYLPDWVPTPGNRRYLAVVREFDAIATTIFARRATGTGQNDLLSLLLQSQKPAGMTIDQRLLRDEIVTLLLAGHETTALALTWTLYLLARHPEAAAGVEREVDAVLGRETRPRAAHLEALQYTGWAISEAMRLYPPVYLLGRECVRDVEIGGHALPAGTICLMSQWVVHRDPRFYRDPQVFRPERWALGGDLRRPRFAYFPFGGGPRVCIGQRLAMMEAVLVLATICRRLRLQAPAGTPAVEPYPSVTLRPASPVRLIVSAR